MEVGEKELVHILKDFIEFCDKNAECGLFLAEFNEKEDKIIKDFIAAFYPDL